MGMKPHMQLLDIIIFSLKHVVVKSTKIIRDLVEASTEYTDSISGFTGVLDTIGT